MPKETITTDADLVKQICRLIISDSQFQTDESWERKWQWHNDPHTVSQGGSWSTLVAAHKIISAVHEHFLSVGDISLLRKIVLHDEDQSCDFIGDNADEQTEHGRALLALERISR